MLCFCELICPFSTRCARLECASGPTLDNVIKHLGSLLLLFMRLFDRQIICKGVGPSMGSRLFFLRTTRDRSGSYCESKRRRCEVLRCRLITEVRASSVFANLAETSRFYSADFLRGSRTSAEPVVFSRVTQVTGNYLKCHDSVKTDFFSRELRYFSSEDDLVDVGHL